jgi:hypothetical protein
LISAQQLFRFSGVIVAIVEAAEVVLRGSCNAER